MDTSTIFTSRATRDVILPILDFTYGSGLHTLSCADYLAQRIDAYERTDALERRGGREGVIKTIVWDFFPGGTTAESVSRDVERALRAAARK